MKTPSESLFERYCDEQGFVVKHLIESAAKSTDYQLTIDGLELTAEIKQFEPTPSELAQKKALRKDEALFLDITPGSRVRKKIKDAAPQLKDAAKGRFPAVLVLYNNRPCRLGNPASAYEVRVGMYGFETIVLKRPSGFGPAEVIDRKFGPGKKLTAQDNTTISAVAVIYEHEEGIELDVYHNVHAAMPLPTGLFARYGAREYTLSDRQDGKFQDWVLIGIRGT